MAVAVFTVDEAHSSTVRSVVSFPTKHSKQYPISYGVAVREALAAQESKPNDSLGADILYFLPKPK